MNTEPRTEIRIFSSANDQMIGRGANLAEAASDAESTIGDTLNSPQEPQGVEWCATEHYIYPADVQAGQYDEEEEKTDTLWVATDGTITKS